MRKLMNERNILIGIIGAVLDSLAIYLASLLGLPSWMTLVVAFLPSMLGNGLISRGVDALCRISAELAAILVFLFLVIIAGLLWAYGDVNVWGNLPWYVVPGLIASVISLIVADRKWKKSREKVLRNFSGSGKEPVFDTDAMRKKMDALKGENGEITGEYDAENAVRCDNGVFVGRETKGVKSFKGIPYALPPVGTLRWKAPRQAEPSQKVYEAFYYGKSEPQPCSGYGYASLYGCSEDCLTLNIWKSSENEGNSPVLVWLDTFDWCVGGTANPMLDGETFVRENPDIIFVNINFRIGLFGNMDFSGIPGGEDYADSKNLGLQDQAEALRWIRRNISAFGGDPGKVTVLGAAGGGTAAALLSVMPQAKGLFSRAVSIGGSVRMTNDLEEFGSCQKTFREVLHAATMEEFLELPADLLGKAVYENGLQGAALPVRDGRLIPEDLKESIYSGSAAGIQLLFSMAKEESLLPCSMDSDPDSIEKRQKEEIQKVLSVLSGEQTWYLKEYMKLYYGSSAVTLLRKDELLTELFGHYPMLSLCRAHSKTGGSCRYLIWEFESPVQGIGSSSLIPTMMILGNEENGERCGVVADPAAFLAVRRAFVNFVRTGDPSFENGEVEGYAEVRWPEYSTADGEVMICDDYGWRPDGGRLTEKMNRLAPLDNVLSV